jgi:branched-subunit amino acid ABC-type transport system permease component
MKIVFTLTFVIAVILSAGIGCLVILEILTFDEGKQYIIKALSVVLLLGVSSAVIALVTGNKNTPVE